MQDEDLKDKVAVVTGGNSGMGRAIALGFGARGARVVVGDLGAEPAPGADDEAQPTMLYRQTDVSNPQDVRELIAFATGRFGRLDILVNNAGINGPLVPLAEQQDADIDAVLGVNLKGTLYGLKYGLREMVKHGAGVIINIASVQGLRPIYAGASIYAASKAAVVSLTRSAAHEYGQYGIRVIAVAPGPIDTPMLRAADPQGQIADAVPLHRIGTPQELANAVLWLASDAASYVSGCVLTVDGAFLAA
jgi:NAD(P)-dependent dehydrogenase (short-subunit alcohol dehydrogenase family)